LELKEKLELYLLMDRIEIRQANCEDLPSILGLYQQNGIDDKEVLSIDEANDMLNKFKQYPNYAIYVATFENEVVGTFALLIMDNLAHKGTPSGVVEDVVVDENFRSRGIGKKMMEFAIEKCRNQGCYKLMLSSNIKRDMAHRFYENLGFKKHGYSFLIEL
jgi:GNAT superfamily N-acetyltransferase